MLNKLNEFLTTFLIAPEHTSHRPENTLQLAIAVLLIEVMRADGSTVELLVLDACYDDVEHALERRLPFVPWPALALFPVRLFAELRIGASANELRPVECLKRIRTPLFMAVGTDDREVGRSAPAEMLAASASEHKQLHWVEGARHEDLWLRKSPALPRALAAFIESAKIE